MSNTRWFTIAGLMLASLLLFGMHTSASAQGRGGGRGGGGGGMGGGMGRGSGGGMGNPGRGAGFPGDERGAGTPSDRGRGHARGGDDNDDRHGGDRDRARGRRDGDAPRTESELHRFNGIARKLNTTPEALRSQYQAALAANPNLKFGQFVAANVVADNLGARHPNVTAQAILSGLQSGQSLGRTLQNLGLSLAEAKQAEREAKRRIKDSDMH